MQQSPYTVRRLTAAIGVEHVVFGSNTPLFYSSSAALKLKEAGMSADQARAISEENARRLCK
jgi:predicted TIM-barrel fold metal-dependent hydrolase